MNEETTVTETDQEAVSNPPEKADFSQQEQHRAPARDFDAEAREMGWVPKEEFQGPEGKWKPAQQFVEDGERILPIVRSQLKREKEERERERQEFARRLERMERIAAENMQRAKAQHEAELQRVRREQREAVEAGDAGRFDELERQREALSKTTFEAPDAPADAKADYERRVTEFQRANQWYGADEELTAFADGYSQRLAARNPNITLEENLRQTAEKVRETFPARFGVKPRAANGHAAVDGGGDFAAPPQKKTLADRLPAEARAKAKEDVNAGLYKNVEEWAKVYFG